ncbi:hypothetical protein PMAYCL1PPCAC_18258, partial [Pristionchus mayeri]
ECLSCQGEDDEMRLSKITPLYYEERKKRREIKEKMDNLNKQMDAIKATAPPNGVLMQALRDLLDHRLHISNKRWYGDFVG